MQGKNFDQKKNGYLIMKATVAEVKEPNIGHVA